MNALKWTWCIRGNRRRKKSKGLESSSLDDLQARASFNWVALLSLHYKWAATVAWHMEVWYMRLFRFHLRTLYAVVVWVKSYYGTQDYLIRPLLFWIDFSVMGEVCKRVQHWQHKCLLVGIICLVRHVDGENAKMHTVLYGTETTFAT